MLTELSIAESGESWHCVGVSNGPVHYRQVHELLHSASGCICAVFASAERKYSAMTCRIATAVTDFVVCRWPGRQFLLR